MWPSSNQNRINLQIIIFRPVINLEFFDVRVFYFLAEDLYVVCAFDDRNNRTLTGRYEANEDMTSYSRFKGPSTCIPYDRPVFFFF